MYNLYSALSSISPDYGINYVKVFYDTLMTGLKCKDDDTDHSYYGHLLFDKINFSYTDGVLQSNKSIVINLGLEKSDVYPYTGNGLVDVSFNQENKEVLIFTLSASYNSFIPLIYSYNINEHSLVLKYPNSDDGTMWEQSTLGTPISAIGPLLSISDNVADILVETEIGGYPILNVLTFDIMNKPSLINYSKYSVPFNLNFDIKKIQRVNNELHFYADNNHNLIPFKITDK